MKDCILKQQLPDLKTAVKRADVNLETWSKSGDSARHASHGACSCSHLLQFLPVNLTLDFVQNTTNAVEQGASWVLEDPVHALHLQSQLDATWLQQLKDAPVLYGEEQERTMVMLSAGLPEAYHPFLKDSPSSPLPVPVPVLEKKDSNDEAVAAEVESRFKISPVVAAMSLSKLWPPLETAASSSGADGLVPPLEPPKAIIAQGVLTSVPSFAPPTTKDALMTMTDGGDDTNKAHPEITASSSGATTVAAVVATGPTPMSKQDIFKPVVEDEKAPESKPITAVPDLGVSASFMTTTEAAANPPAVPSVTMLQPVTANASTAYVTASPAPPSPTTTTANPVLTASALALAAEPALTTSMLPILTKTEDKPPLMSTDQPSASDVAVTAAEPPPPAASISPTAVSSPFETNLPDPTATNLPVTAPLVAATTSVSPNLVDSLPDVASTYELSDARYWGLHAEEDQIRILRRSLMAKRAPIVKKKATQSSKKRKNNEGKPINLVQLSAWKSKPVVQLTAEELAAWEEGYRKGKTQVELWMEHYRLSRELYWDEQRQSRRPQTSMATFGSLEPNASQVRSCQLCRSPQDKRVWRCGASGHIRRDFSGDDLMQCLECSFVGCAPVCAASGSRQHILQHMLLSNHKFAVTCGPKAAVYCFKCGDYVYHEIFDQEKERLDIVEKLPSHAWNKSPIQRSFDPFRFLHIQDEGIIWKGMVATYPLLVPQDHVLAARLSRKRQILFEGEMEELSLLASPNAKAFAAWNSQKSSREKWRIKAPVGMYNLGNTCFMSAILQCLINCVPFQKYFLHETGHHHLSCETYRKTQKAGTSPASSSSPTEGSPSALVKKKEEVCLGCEMDKLFLKYFGSTIGVDVTAILAETAQDKEQGRSIFTDAEVTEIPKGQPLITADMLTAAWQCGGMDHLAGYAQRDAHEFLHGFLDVLGKNARQYRERMYKTIKSSVPGNAIITADKFTENDAIKALFEGTLRSVLMCQDCGNKRIQSEPFMSLSLPLSKEVQKATNELPGESNEAQGRVKVSVERCLRHFTIPEMLADPVDCPSCGKKTPTKKQHVVSKLPRVLCLHLKRFDAAQNKKIEDFVSFPAQGLNMGPHLPHWCEVTKIEPPDDTDTESFTPQILYDLFGTVNHYGNLQSGHYVTNVKVDKKWFHCNDAYVCDAGVGDGEAEVMKSDGAYLLFYIRR